MRRRDWRTIKRAVLAFVLLLVFLVAVPGLRPDPQSTAFGALGYARDHLFDFVSWEGRALFDKAANAVVAPHRYMTSGQQVAYVRSYLDLVAQVQRLDARIYEVYSDPAIEDPALASIYLRAERDRLRDEQRSRQAIAEAILQDQVSEVLLDYGFGAGGQLWPPVALRFTELPTVLVVSPRDRIERIGSYPLQHGITVEERERIEANVDAELDVSSLVTPIGGLAIWPAMLVETGYLPSVPEVAAHEWSHHYLAFYPLGFNYGASPELYTLNETVASIVGAEIRWAVLDRYYPDLAPVPPDYSPLPGAEAAPPPGADPAAFDFGAEMRATRIEVDRLLAAGRVEEAERYMETRRREFARQGYTIRKLNQAYFAFHGSYADEPGATGADPIGPALRELRYHAGSLVDFVAEVRGLTTLDELMLAVAERRAAAGAEPYGAR